MSFQGLSLDPHSVCLVWIHALRNDFVGRALVWPLFCVHDQTRPLDLVREPLLDPHSASTTRPAFMFFTLASHGSVLMDFWLFYRYVTRFCLLWFVCHRLPLSTYNCEVSQICSMKPVKTQFCGGVQNFINFIKIIGSFSRWDSMIFSSSG
jgi:hypothetical protein